MVTIEAIETEYNGQKYRSRLEARWAIVFDKLSLEFEYEPQKFDLGEMYYIPDFWLPSRECWIEIKGQAPNPTEIRKARLLFEATEKKVFILYGMFEFQKFECRYCKDKHYTEIPCGVGIMPFRSNDELAIKMPVQIDEFIFWLMGNQDLTDKPHLALSKVHSVFQYAIDYKFPEDTPFKSLSDKFLKKALEQARNFSKSTDDEDS